MEWVETTGRTIAEALDAALDELGVDEHDVDYEVLEQPKSGFLGRIGATEARIRARVKPISREKPGDRQRREKRSRSRRERGGGGRPAPAPAPPAATVDQQDAEPAPGLTATAAATGAGGSRSGSSSRRRRRRGGGRRPGEQAAAGTAPAGLEGDQEDDVSTAEFDVSVEEQAEVAERFTRGLVAAFALGARVETVIEDDVVTVAIQGDNLGLLVGPKGATMHAIEELVRTVVQRETDGHGARIYVDVAGYRAKRRAALEGFTREVAQKVIDSGRPMALEPMPSSDRKIVHDTAAEIDGIASESEGDDPRRRVVLRPA
jgi:spoIIIJ-associated protein